MKSKSAKKALEGTHGGDVMGGSPVDRGKPSGLFLYSHRTMKTDFLNSDP